MAIFPLTRPRLHPDDPERLHISWIDMHTGGEPLRVVLEGFPDLPGHNILERRRYCQEHLDHLRTALMWEPRGHADMYGCILTAPDSPEADFGIIFMHNDGYSTMCGHAVIAITRLAAYFDWKPRRSNGEMHLMIDVPCGRITSMLTERNAPYPIQFEGVPSFVVALDQEVELPDQGTIRYDLAYGGAYYAYVDSRQMELRLIPDNHQKIIELGMQIKAAIEDTCVPIHHPFESDLSFLYGTIFINDDDALDADSRNACVFAKGELDRSPTGSGVSGRLAIHHARDEIDIGEQMTVESLIGSKFRASIERLERYGPFQAVIPLIEGDAYVTGEGSSIIDPQDPFGHGFFLR